MVEGSIFSLEKLVEDAMLLEEMKITPPSKKQVEKANKLFGKKEKRL
jgi:hypothetical protein